MKILYGAGAVVAALALTGTGALESTAGRLSDAIETDASGATARVPLDSLSQTDVQQLIQSWGLGRLAPFFKASDGLQLSFFDKDDLAHALDNAAGVDERLAFKTLFARLQEVLDGGVRLPSASSPEPVLEMSSPSAKRRLVAQEEVVVQPNGALNWDDVDLSDYSGVAIRANTSSIKLGAPGNDRTAIFKASPDWLAVQGNLTVEGNVMASNIAMLQAQVAELMAFQSAFNFTSTNLAVDGNLTVKGEFDYRYKQTHISSYLDKIDQLGDAVLELEGLLKNSKVSPDESCLAAHERCSDCESGVYWIETDSMASPQEMYCDMESNGGGWTLVGVALVDYAGDTGWNDDDGMNLALSYSLDDHWHQTATIINDLLGSGESITHVACFDSNNDFERFWYGTGTYSWEAVSGATNSSDTYGGGGTGYSTVWASHHYGLVSGNNEYVTVITSHSGNHWACGGLYGAGGEGYTGRGGDSNFRMWVR